MTELISIKEMSLEMKILLLRELGYSSDEKFVLDSNGNRHIDKYIEEPVKIDNMLIFPGSAVIIDNNPISIASFLEEYGDVF